MSCATAVGLVCRDERARPADTCAVCRVLVRSTNDSYDAGYTTAAELRPLLESGCAHLLHASGPAAVQECLADVGAYVSYLVLLLAAGDSPTSICVHFGLCETPNVTRADHAHPPTCCETCEWVGGRPQSFLHRHPMCHERQLGRELERDCVRLSYVQGEAGGHQCRRIVNRHLHAFFLGLRQSVCGTKVCRNVCECATPPSEQTFIFPQPEPEPQTPTHKQPEFTDLPRNGSHAFANEI